MTHPDCSGCCAQNRCHWCLSKPGTSIVSTEIGGIEYRACRKHAEFLLSLDVSSTNGAQRHPGLMIDSGSPLTLR